MFGCKKTYKVSIADILDILRWHHRLYCLNCLDYISMGDYWICENCGSKNPLGSLECIYCGHIEVPL